jgi:molybdopterin synthase sulfur carrier subunit
MVEVRFFAAARAAVGSVSVSAPTGTLAAVLAAFDFPVIAKCSLLVNGVAESDRTRVLTDGDTVDVLPPFAGG